MGQFDAKHDDDMSSPVVGAALVVNDDAVVAVASTEVVDWLNIAIPAASDVVWAVVNGIVIGAAFVNGEVNFSVNVAVVVVIVGTGTVEFVSLWKITTSYNLYGISRYLSVWPKCSWKFQVEIQSSPL